MKPKRIPCILLSVFSLAAMLLASCSQQKTSTPVPFQKIFQPEDITGNSSGTLFVTDISNFYILSVNDAGTAQPFVNVNMKLGCSGDGGSCYFASLSGPFGITTDNSGNIYFTDAGCHTLHKIDAATNMMSLIAGNGSQDYSGDGGPALSAGLFGPAGIAIDKNNNLFLVDGYRIRKVVLATGVITTVAGDGTASFGGDGGPALLAQIQPGYVAVDNLGNIYISDLGNYRIRKVTAGINVITTIAGNGIIGYNGDSIPATSARINYPAGIKVDTAGNVYFCDRQRVRKIDSKTNLIYTVAGGGTNTSLDYSGSAKAVSLGDLSGLTFDAKGNFYFLDNTNLCIRKVDISTGIINTILHN